MTSNANVTTEVLRTLHRIHRQLNDLNERLARGPRLIQAHEVNIERANKQLDEAQGAYRSLRVATDEKQLLLGNSEATIQKRELQLSQASSNVEYQALKDEIAATQAANEVHEIEILEALEKLDTLAEDVSKRKADLAQAEQETAKVREEVNEKKPRIEGDIHRLQKELASHENTLPDDFREHYFRLVQARGEDALAGMTGEFCGGCNQQVPVNMVNDLMLSRPITCLACGRLLYLPEGDWPV